MFKLGSKSFLEFISTGLVGPFGPLVQESLKISEKRNSLIYHILKILEFLDRKGEFTLEELRLYET